MAGSGWRDFVTGELVTEPMVQGYLMDQAVMVFATAAARDSALSGVVAEGMHAYLSDSNTLVRYDGSAWVAAGFQTVRKNSTGTVFGPGRLRLNFIEGSGVTLTIADDGAGDEVDITIAATATAPTVVVKNSDESVTSSTTLQDDNELQIAVGANKSYAFDAVLYVDTDSTPDFKLAFVVPTAATVIWSPVWPAGATSTANMIGTNVVTGSDTPASLTIDAASEQIIVVVHGSVVTGANSGSLVLRWAQNNSSATAATVKAGSTLTVVQEV